MVVDETTGVVKLVPDPMLVPPVRLENQFIVPADAVACNTTAPLPQLMPGVVPVIVGTCVTVATTAVLASVVQLFAVAST